ncbi:alanine racemase [Azorhizobium oxalatiphilum]|uniref:Alanine racemase n=1 Tax=Azorhizobium oxalatiphilum TaxID=980631 RepID=A0A917FJ74_9HYPH|nr:alanine racemase [Azorhizobium oxalatiphilum]GGF87198.1 alanine racemase [Azorhizobium oxalatiphilum]
MSDALEGAAVLTIDLGALAANWQAMARRVAPAACAAVVKADAYGLGIERAAPALWAAGARTFFVAQFEEGRTLRALLPEAEILVLGGLLPGLAPLFARHALRPVLGSLPEVAEWAAFCRAEGADQPAALHVDTGMNRLGLTPDGALVLAGQRDGLGFTPCLIMSHLACADVPDHPLTALQLARFSEVARAFPDVRASLANSAGVLTSPAFHFDLVRPGIAVYGGTAIDGQPPLRPVVRLEAPIIQVRDGAADETVGYGASQRLARDSRIAIISIGYADGFLRAFGASDGAPGAEAIVRGQRCPLVGRVSMDLAAVDVTDVPGVARGDRAVLLGDGIGIDELATHGRTIGYEVLTSLGPRYARIYIDAPAE